jgi:hypothetical protein
MNIQIRKLNLIEEFLKITDENLIIKLESFLKQEKKNTQERSIKALSMNEFHEMIDQAKQESEAGFVISHRDLKMKVKTWK